MLRLNHITFASRDPQLLASFWADVLGYEVVPSDGDAFARGDGPELLFKLMPKSPTIEVPIHLDVNVPDREAEVQRLLDIGATLVETRTSEAGEYRETHTVMRDPEGNGFCVQAPSPRNPRPSIGNVTFSAAEPRRVLGPFWCKALAWPEQEVPNDLLDMLRQAGVDVDREFYSYYATMNPDGTRPRLLFQRRERSRPQHYPLHLDFRADDQEAEVERLVGLGATIVKRERWTVLRDPEGNPFCVE